jgi:hypothetical protein
LGSVARNLQTGKFLHVMGLTHAALPDRFEK